MDIEIAQNAILVVLAALIFFMYIIANTLDKLAEDMDKEGMKTLKEYKMSGYEILAVVWAVGMMGI